MVPSPKQLIHALGTGHPEMFSYKPKLQCFMWDPTLLFDDYSIRTTFQQVLFVSNFEKKNKSHPIHIENSAWTPSATGIKGAKFDGIREKFCSSVDSCWNCHRAPASRQILQLIIRDLDPPCSTLTMRSPVWNRSSTPGI
jgi:hypothetical protein